MCLSAASTAPWYHDMVNRTRMPTSAPLLALLCISLCVPQAAAQCEVPFALGSSNLTFGGGVVEPLPAQLSPAHPEARLGLEGRVLAAWPGAAPPPGPCPNNATGLAAQLAGAAFKTTAEWGPVQLYPPLIEASGRGHACVAQAGAGGVAAEQSGWQVPGRRGC